MAEGFQRARRPEQVAARRDAILATATTMLGEKQLAEISLRDLSCRVGLAKSNVLRYFDSREAIYLEVLEQQYVHWLDDLAATLPVAAAHPEPGRYGKAEAVAVAIAVSLSRRRLLCELISAMTGVLERNISLEFARDFKRRAAVSLRRLVELVRAELPEMSEPAADAYAAGLVVILAGLWPCAEPTETVATAMAELGHPPAAQLFADSLTEALRTHIVGTLVRYP